MNGLATEAPVHDFHEFMKVLKLKTLADFAH
jgi:hypothetical protein